MAESQPSQDQEDLLSRSGSSLDLDQEGTQQDEPPPEEAKGASLSEPSEDSHPLQEEDPEEQNQHSLSDEDEGQSIHVQDMKRSNSIPGQTSDEEEPPPSYSQLLQSHQLLPWPQYQQNHQGQNDYQLLNEHLRSHRQHPLQRLRGQQHQQQQQQQRSNRGSEERCVLTPPAHQLSELPLFRVLEHPSRQLPARGLPTLVQSPVDGLERTCRTATVKLVCLGLVYGIATVIALNVVALYFNDYEGGFYPLLAILVFSSFLGILTALRLFFSRASHRHRFTPLENAGNLHPGPITDVSSTYRRSMESDGALPPTGDGPYPQTLGMPASSSSYSSSSSTSQNPRYPQEDKPPAYTDIFPDS
ncbi:uncharacterized protein LOC135224966 [Macrobrachium nipponense]|uniref:uncharacterized protein LOC135224966 n=1 Tax=Macrobrachium nipponense TaxID=159736 RepID=UPI0030C8C231